MSSTNKTTYYELPQYVESDIFNPLVDDNDAYSKIDTALHNIAEAEAGVVSDITTINNKLTADEAAIDALETQNGNEHLVTTAQTLSGAVNELKIANDNQSVTINALNDDVNNATTGLKVKVAAETLARQQADASLNDEIEAETSNRISADNNLSAAISTEATARANADITINQSITSEANARIAADNGLAEDISDEASARISAVEDEESARISADALLQTQIDNIVAPSGEAPNPAEIVNARIGYNNEEYTALGGAIRGQVEDIHNVIDGDDFSPYDIIRVHSVVKYWHSSSLYVNNLTKTTKYVKYGDYQHSSNYNYEIFGLVCKTDKKLYVVSESGGIAQDDVINTDYYMIVDVDAATGASVGLTDINAEAWGGANLVAKKNVTLKAGRNIIKLDNLVALNALPQNTELVNYFASFDSVATGTSNANLALVYDAYGIFAAHAVNADYSDFAKKAGWNKVDAGWSDAIISSAFDPYPIRTTREGYILDLRVRPYTDPIDHFKFYFVYTNINSLIGHGYKFMIRVKNANFNSNFNVVKVCPQYNSWANAIFSAENNSELNWECQVDIDSLNTSGMENVYLLVGFDSELNPTAGVTEAITHSFEYMLIDSSNVVVANTCTGDIIASKEYVENYVTDVLSEKLPEDMGDYDMVFWGDSLTAGAGGSGVRYSDVCANLLGLSHKDCAVGGEAEQTIAARQGGNNLIIPAGNVNGTYALNQMVDAHGKPVHPLRQGNGGNTVNPVTINGQTCTLTITQDSATDPNAVYTISGYVGTLLYDTPALFSGSKVYGDITVIWAGTNGLADNTVEERISYIKSMLSRVNNKYVVMGVTAGTASDRSAEESALLNEFGNHYFNTRKALVENGLNVQGITPTPQDLADISVGTVPTSLRTDEIHLNADGYTALGKILAGYIVGLGYANFAS